MADVVGSGVNRVIMDADGEVATVTNGKLDVNADLTVAGDINVGNVDVVTVPAPLSTTGDGTRSGVLRVTIASNSSMPNSQGYGTVGHKNNTSVGNSSFEQLTTDDTPCKHVDVMALLGNTGVIFVGGSGASTSSSIALYGGDVYSMDIDNVNKIYVIASVDGEDVCAVYYV